MFLNLSIKLKQKREKMSKRIAVLDKEVCTKEKCGYVCIKICPVNRMGKECIVIDENTSYPSISEDLCIGCGICVKKCPTNAITIINLTKDLGNPIFSYGKNAFRLHGLPLPKENVVVGFIGKNGIGKTTAIKLLSGQLKPNFGNEFKEELMDELPIEQRNYLKSLKTIRLSVKPQNIEKLRSSKISVDELLNELKIPHEILNEFELEKIKSRKLNELSGGELQKLSIAIALSKKADIYYFDELTNFLDIKERLKMAIKLKEFGKDNTTIIVDHDLAILDYLVDYVYVFFGEEDVYGAVSSIKPARNGINEYLNGFLKAENLKIRDFEIKFSTYSELESSAEIVLRYPSLQKTYPNFSLKVEGGEIKKGEIVGIAGGNALGKTTFIKMLAGVEKPDNTNIQNFLTISYKKQYLERTGRYVREILKGGNEFILRRGLQLFNIPNRLLEKKDTSLSGGQLQRIAVLYALSREADIYLLDEPSAFLDIEQRLALAELVKDVAETENKIIFVVDHDITLLDRIASRLIVFTGIPSMEGRASKPLLKKEGMNLFLKEMDITMRRDKDSKRPKINKKGSVVDRKQREEGNYYAFE